MSSRGGFALAVILLLFSAFLRSWNLADLPAGLHDDEVIDIRIAETVRAGGVEVFYDLGGEGREGLYHAALAGLTGVFGNGLLGYHIVSVWTSMMALALIYALGSRLFGPTTGVLALALMSTNMWLILLSRQVAREMLLPALVTAALLVISRALQVYRESHPRLPLNTVFAVQGLLLGVGFYLHPAHFLIVLFGLAFIGYSLFTRRQQLPAQTRGYLLFSLLVMIIVATPYLISSIRLPELSGANRIFGDFRLGLTPLFQSITGSLSGLFFVGDQSAVRNLPGRPLIDLVSGLFVMLGLFSAIQQRRQPRYALLLMATLALLPVSLLSAHSPDFRSLVILLPLIALFFALGVTTLYRSLSRSVRQLMPAGMVVLFAFNLIWTGRDFFSIWPELPAVYDAYHMRIGQLARHLDETASALPAVVCESDRQVHKGEDLSATDLLLLMLNQKEVRLRYVDCGTGLVLVNGGEAQQIIMPDIDTLDKMQPYLRNWVMRGDLLVGENIPPDSVVELRVAQELADTVGRFTTTAPAAYAPESPGGIGLAVPPVQFGGNIAFLGYEDTGEGAFPPGGVVTSIVYWRVDGVVPPDLRFFTHILSDPAACCVAQNDTISVNVSQLLSRDVIIQVTFVPLPLSVPAGDYSLSIGAYLQSDGTRMPVLDGGKERGTRLFIDSVKVAPNG